MADQSSQYEAKDALGAGLTGITVLGGAGLAVSAIQNTMRRSNIGPWGVFSATGSTVAIYALMGGSYMFVRTASANLRRKDDAYNSAWGGLVAGSIAGLRAGRFPVVIGYGAMLSVVMSAFEYSGGKISGYDRDPNIDEFDRKEALRKNRRRPLDETIAELGEGRGIYGPGYQERRREHFKDKYGIDIPAYLSK